tara:strand:- start:15 stop:278 length:264 start_codon:yes stop_codon:yes gene_type:complete
MAYIQNNDSKFSVTYNDEKIIWNGLRHATEQECINMIAERSTPEEIATEKQRIKDEETAKEANKASGKVKLKDLGLNDDEVEALFGV